MTTHWLVGSSSVMGCRSRPPFRCVKSVVLVARLSRLSRWRSSAAGTGNAHERFSVTAAVLQTRGRARPRICVTAIDALTRHGCEPDATVIIPSTRTVTAPLLTTSGWRGQPRAPRPLRAPLRLIVEPPHDVRGPADVRLAQLGAHRRGDRQEPGAHRAVARITLASKAHQLRSPMPRIVDELHEPSVASSSASRCMRWWLVGRIWAIWGRAALEVYFTAARLATSNPPNRRGRTPSSLLPMHLCLTRVLGPRSHRRNRAMTVVSCEVSDIKTGIGTGSRSQRSPDAHELLRRGNGARSERVPRRNLRAQ